MQRNISEIIDESYLEKIKSDLFQIKLLLAVLIVIALFGFFGPEKVIAAITRLVFWMGIILAAGYLFLLILEKLFFKKGPKSDKELEQVILQKVEAARKQKPVSNLSDKKDA